jgi:hypothetical protein
MRRLPSKAFRLVPAGWALGKALQIAERERDFMEQAFS